MRKSGAIALPGGARRAWWACGLGCAALGALCGAAAADPLADAQAALARFEEAKTAAAKAIEAGDGAGAEAQSAAARGHLAAARDAFAAGGLPAAGDAALRAQYIEVLRTLGDYDLAAEALRAELAAHPADAARWLALGECALECGPKFRSEAVAALRKALALNPADDVAAAAVAKLGDAYYGEGLFELAKAEYGKALEKKPDDTRTRIALAALKVRSGALAEGAADIDALGRAAQPLDAFVRARLRDALADYDAQRRWFPDTAEHHRAYARTLYRAARLPEAVLAARRVAQLEPGDAATWNFLAAMQGQLGNLQGAKSAYEGSLKANPNQPEVTQALQQIDQRLKQAPPTAAPAPPAAIAAPAPPDAPAP